MSRRNPQPIEGRGLLQEPADERLVEDRRKALLVKRALLVERPGPEHDRRVETMQARERVAGAEDMPEQAVMIEIAGEEADATAAERRPLVPVSARGRIELCAQPTIVGGDVGARIGAAEEAEEAVVVRQILSRADLEPAERDMRPVEVDRGDARRIGGQVGKHIAAARGDRDHLMSGADVERLHVDDRILPDLRIDQPLEREREQALEHARARQRLRAMDSSLEPSAGGATRIVARLPHEAFPVMR